jgi:hypothetical protein
MIEILSDTEEKMEKKLQIFYDEMRVAVDYNLSKCKKVQKELMNYFTTKIQKGK